MRLKAKVLGAACFTVILLVLGSAGWLWERNGAYGFNTLLRRGGTYWISLKADDPLLSPSMQTALLPTPPEAQAGAFSWQEPEAGFETAEMPVIADGKEVDRILLSRIDPTKYRFIAVNDPTGGKGVDEWETAFPKAVLIVNGSYYDLHGQPDTPIISVFRHGILTPLAG